jgi:transposase
MEFLVLHHRVIGLDVHHEQVTACALIDQGDGIAKPSFQAFATFHNDCQALAAWAYSFQPDLVVMESTGVYWKAVYRSLTSLGLKTLVVNARHIKKVPGRKTDLSDSHWLAILARAGLLKGSFMIETELERLRLIARQRQKLAGMAAAEKNRLHKVLVDSGLRLSLVVSDLSGLSARRMIKCLLGGGTIQEALRGADPRLKASPEMLQAALEGDLSDAHCFVLYELLQHIEALEAAITRFEEQLLAGLSKYEWALRLLETIPGVNRTGAAMVLVEIGVNMEAFGSAAHLVSWAGMCPGQNESAGKRKSTATRKGNPWLRRLLCEMAQAAQKTISQFKAKHQCLAFRRGYKRAIVAIGHKILRVIYVLLKRREPYRDGTVDYEELMVKRNAPRWIQALKRYNLLPQSA